MYQESKSRRVSLKLTGEISGAKSYNLENVRLVEDLSLPKHTVDVEALTTWYKYLHDVPNESMRDIRDQELNEQVKESFSTETFVVNVSAKSLQSKDDEAARKIRVCFHNILDVVNLDVTFH
ncbi:unnamed protein product [Allacma fusca]|uniref:Uncharacterized protein n=1 Tax=Allacma fusca TaxID=39272 RepID=A0A8J2PQU9_9HEXA|nr:unnamed protein product [Allacma fusca]